MIRRKHQNLFFISILLICFSINIFAEDGITFKIEKLSKPKNLLQLKSYDEIYKRLILKAEKLSMFDVKKYGIKFKYNIIAKSKAPKNLVNFGFHSFFKGLYSAYAKHRPFVLSPDTIWLLISQGFARHVNANHEKLRKYFVNFSGKLTLLVKSKHNLLKDSFYWEDIFPKFTSQIAEHTGKELINILTSNFSTTTAVEKIASEIAIMEAMKPYFEFVVIYVVCGIPEITLRGTTEDWQKILDKTRKLGSYDLKWWTKKLIPILKEFVKTSKGNINKRFWRNMFKIHSQKKYGAPDIINGWIVKFFPYDKDGKRNNLKKLFGGERLPEEMIKVDLKFIEINAGSSKQIMLELWAGFIGLEQNPKTFALTPKISWMIRKKDINQTGLEKKIKEMNIPNNYFGQIVDLQIIKVPDVLKKIKVIFALGLNFKEGVFIPKWMKDIKIGILNIYGKISEKEKEKIIQWFPNTELNINGKIYNKDKNGWIKVFNNRFTEDILKLEKIWILEVSDIESYKHKFIIPDEIKNIKIKIFSIHNTPSKESLEKLKKLLPDTKIFIKSKRIQ